MKEDTATKSEVSRDVSNMITSKKAKNNIISQIHHVENDRT